MGFWQRIFGAREVGPPDLPRAIRKQAVPERRSGAGGAPGPRLAPVGATGAVAAPVGPAEQDEARVSALNARIVSLHKAAEYAEAIPLAREVLAIQEAARNRGPSEAGKKLPSLGEVQRIAADYEVMKAVHTLAVLLHAHEELAEARTLFERILVFDEGKQGKDHPDVAVGLDNLAQVLKQQGELAEARPLLERALAIRERALRRDDPLVAQSLASLGEVLREKEPAKALPLLERALSINERAYGKEHPQVAVDLKNLAFLLAELGDHARARRLGARALAILDNELGAS